MGVGMPADLYLHEFGSQVWAAFGEPPYHVGSSLTLKSGWRDVDVRLILPDDAYAALEIGKPNLPRQNGKWVALCMAFSALGRHMTGLTRANDDYPRAEHPRSSLGIIALRLL
jgi:hypothetical protein